MNKIIEIIRKKLKPITKLFIAFVLTAILFQVITDVKLLNIDIVNNVNNIINDIGNDTTMAIVALIILLNILGKKVNIY
jgi:hypothetical protein|tara:strand:+ start:507 stop:743 length:237 start_codon:yes stop_codon:yes gene_type:complete